VPRPNTAGDEVMKLVVADATVARRHRLDALAITRLPTLVGAP
jgi:hypothetical protein